MYFNKIEKTVFQLKSDALHRILVYKARIRSNASNFSGKSTYFYFSNLFDLFHFFHKKIEKSCIFECIRFQLEIHDFYIFL